MSSQFKESILKLNRAQNTATSTLQQQEAFLTFAENEGRLPQDANVTLIDAFLQNLTTLLTNATSGGYDVGSRSIKLLNSYIQANEQIKARFNPSRQLIQKMNLDMLLKDTQSQPAAVELCSLLLRNVPQIEYDDFTKDPAIQTKLQRLEQINAQQKLAKLLHEFTLMSNDQQDHKATTGQAFQEMLVLIDQQSVIANQKFELLDQRENIAKHEQSLSQIKGQLQKLHNAFSDMNAQVHSQHGSIMQGQEKIIGIQNELKLFQSQAFNQFKDLADMKETDFNKRVNVLKSELNQLQENIAGRFEDRIGALEAMQEKRAAGFTQLLEGYEAKTEEANKLVRASIFAHVDKNTLDALRRSQEHTNESLKSMRQDTETMLRRLGANMQQALESIQHSTQQDNDHQLQVVKQQLDAFTDEHRIKSQSQLQDHLSSINNIKTETARLFQMEQQRQNAEVQKIIAHAQKSIEQTINTSISPAIKTLQLQQKSSEQHIQQLLDSKSGLQAKVDKSHEILEDHLDLVQTLNLKVDTTAQLLDENKAFIIEKLRHFEAGVVQELKNATQHLDLAAYEASFSKLENDVVDIVNDLSRVKQELGRDDLAQWRLQVSQDLKMFYEKYDSRLRQVGLSDEDRKMIQDTVNQMGQTLRGAQSSIKNLATAMATFEANLDLTERKRLENYHLFSQITAAHDTQLSGLDNQFRSILPEIQQHMLEFTARNDSSQFKSMMRDYDVKFNKALDEQRLFIDEIGQMFNVNKLRNELDKSLDAKVAAFKAGMTQDILLYIQKMLSNKFLEQPVERDIPISQKLSLKPDSSLVVDLKSEIDLLKEQHRSIEAKVEDYKDDFVNRLSVYRSFETNASSIAPRQSSQSNPLTSRSLHLKEKEAAVANSGNPAASVQSLFEYFNGLISLQFRWIDEDLIEKMLLLKVPGMYDEKLTLIGWITRRAMYFNIDQITQMVLKLRQTMRDDNIEFVTFAHDNNIAERLVSQVGLLLSGVNDSKIPHSVKGQFGDKSTYNYHYNTNDKKMAWILYLLSTVMHNTMCADHARRLNIMELLFQIIEQESSPNQVITSTFTQATKVLQVAIKQDSGALMQLAKSQVTVERLIKCLSYGMNNPDTIYTIEIEDTFLNCAFCLYYLIKSQKTYKEVAIQHPQLGQALLDLVLSKRQMANALNGNGILSVGSAALVSYLQNPQLAETFSSEAIEMFVLAFNGLRNAVVHEDLKDLQKNMNTVAKLLMRSPKQRKLLQDFGLVL